MRMIRQSSGARHYPYYLPETHSEKMRKNRDKEEVELAMELVLEHCHPSQLDELPPSPALLIRKALLLGLITSYSSLVCDYLYGEL